MEIIKKILEDLGDFTDRLLYKARYFDADIELCRLRLQLDDEKKRIYYCKNKEIGKSLERIGRVYGDFSASKKSKYAQGIDIVCQTYQEMFKEHLYVAEVKRLVRPHRKRKRDKINKKDTHGKLVVPYKLINILDCISFLTDTAKTDKPENSPHDLCKIRMASFSAKNNGLSFFCYHFLVYDLLWQLGHVSGGLRPGSRAADVYADLLNNTKKCI